jgi:hypothetical protein
MDGRGHVLSAYAEFIDFDAYEIALLAASGCSTHLPTLYTSPSGINIAVTHTVLILKWLDSFRPTAWPRSPRSRRSTVGT